MLRIQDISGDRKEVVVRVEGRLDRDSLPILKGVLNRHKAKKLKILVHLEGLMHIDKEARNFLQAIRDEVVFENLPEFLKLEMGFEGKKPVIPTRRERKK
ncbi:MAG: hypothetical protein JRF59_09570 [Deltaproteobacteria bacterium]|nr:hypothetical protein [Deltaproteobacteria bacterium]MBW2348077.1 hypothetical protein [Deltaproteobacteria bacterium]RLB38737.1 MAG: hypothetical protein DRH20_05120 [Deltaproteobacteria bacterium]